MGTVTVHFRGACTHFRGVVPGVPHRVVLVEAAAIRLGVLEANTANDWPSSPQRYVLFPHTVFIDVEPARRLDVPGVLVDGSLYTGAHLQIANGVTNGGVDYRRDFLDEIPRVTDYVDDYQYSADVVLAGKGASSYFDVFSGHVAPEMDGGSRHARITIETAGNPVLRVTPFKPEPGTKGSVEIELPVVADLYVANRDVVEGGTTHLDFLLHFLTARDGLPRHLKREPFGAGERPKRPTPPNDDDYGADLSLLLKTGWPRTHRRPMGTRPTNVGPLVGTAASCSDSQYP